MRRIQKHMLSKQRCGTKYGRETQDKDKRSSNRWTPYERMSRRTPEAAALIIKLINISLIESLVITYTEFLLTHLLTASIIYLYHADFSHMKFIM